MRHGDCQHSHLCACHRLPTVCQPTARPLAHYAASEIKGKPLQVSGLSTRLPLTACDDCNLMLTVLLPCSLQRLQKASTACQAYCGSCISTGESCLHLGRIAIHDAKKLLAVPFTGTCKPTNKHRHSARACRGGAAVQIPRLVQVCCYCTTEQGDPANLSSWQQLKLPAVLL